jgi:hypothetical protein
LSLYDFLGKAAGKELGGKVAQAAYQVGIKPQNREISNSKYTGNVHLYPSDFLEDYFESVEDLPGSIDWSAVVLDNNGDEDDLPF